MHQTKLASWPHFQLICLILLTASFMYSCKTGYIQVSGNIADSEHISFTYFVMETDSNTNYQNGNIQSSGLVLSSTKVSDWCQYLESGDSIENDCREAFRVGQLETTQKKSSFLLQIPADSSNITKIKLFYEVAVEGGKIPSVNSYSSSANVWTPLGNQYTICSIDPSKQFHSKDDGSTQIHLEFWIPKPKSTNQNLVVDGGLAVTVITVDPSPKVEMTISKVVLSNKKGIVKEFRPLMGDPTDGRCPLIIQLSQK